MLNHVQRTLQRHCRDGEEGIGTDWPALGPERSLIDYVLTFMKQKDAKMTLYCCIYLEMFAKECNKTTVGTLHHLVSMIPEYL